MGKAYKLDGAKFTDMESLKEDMWAVYADKMSKEEFEKYVEQHVEVVEA